MLWVKLIHIVMIIAWMVGIFYLPRIFVHYAEGRANNEGVERVKIMGQKLFSFTTIMAVFAIISGSTLWLHYKIGFGSHWVMAKLGFVVYHALCGVMLKRMKNDTLNWSSKALRWFNELPLFLLVAILYFVIFKPF
jgi:protoporphyrinogen IX oxidase